MSHFHPMLSLKVIKLIALISSSAVAEDQAANKAKVPEGAKSTWPLLETVLIPFRNPLSPRRRCRCRLSTHVRQLTK